MTRGPRTRTFPCASLLVLAVAGCAARPEAPAQPTWADVEPILRAECTTCHGGSAALAGSTADLTYRLDFFDMTSEICGDAAIPTDGIRFAAAAAGQIARDVTSDSSSVRPRMPPEPAPWLADWQWQTLLRWARAPLRGPAPMGNRPPLIRITSPSRVVGRVFTLSAVLEDPDGDSAVGVLRVGDVTLRMDRPGQFSIQVDASQWGLNGFDVSGETCDGWSHAKYDQATLGFFAVGG
jgi:hypothetical protein